MAHRESQISISLCSWRTQKLYVALDICSNVSVIIYGVHAKILPVEVVFNGWHPFLLLVTVNNYN